REPPSGTEARPVRSDEGFLGVIIAGEVLDISSKIDGRVTDVFVQVGQKVQKGAPIARIDVPVLAQELIGAESQLRAAESQYRRRVPLLRSNAISREELEVARANQVQAESRVKQIRQQIAEARVIAPYDGTIGRRFVTPGAIIGA